jgi:hypothetical protein
LKFPQLSLRDLFWLVALVAMGCGWWVEHRRVETLDARVKELEEENRNLSYDLDEQEKSERRFMGSWNRTMERLDDDIRAKVDGMIREEISREKPDDR